MMNSLINSDELLPCNAKWQVTVNLLAKYLNVPAGLIMRITEREIEVFVASKTEGNPYIENTKLNKGEGRYCETVLKDNEILNIPNALKDKKWKNNPDLALDMISYLGVPILWPDKSVFGSICVLDNKERHFESDSKELLQQFRSLFESDLKNLVNSKDLIEKERATSTEKEKNFQHLFNKNPISLWEEDFTEAIILLDKLKKKGITDVKAYLDKNPEFVQECAKKIKIININEASVKLHKATNKEDLIDNLQKTFNENSFEVFKHELTAFANGETSFESEYEILSLKGETIYVILKIIPVDQNEKILSRAIVSLYDITGKVKSRKKIEKINRQLLEERNVFTKGNVVVFKWQNTDNWPVEYVSQNVSNVFGYSVKDFVSGKITFGDIIHKKDKQRVTDEIKESKQNNEDNFEHKPYRIVHKNGKIGWLYDFTTVIKNKKGEITHYLGYVKDITKRKLLELEKELLFEAVTKQRNEFESLTEEFQILNEELEYRNVEIKESEERFKKLSRSTFEGILIHKKGIVKDLNENIVKMFGYTRNELMGKDIIKLIVLANYQAIIFQHSKAKSATIYEIEGRKKDGSIIPLEIRSQTTSYNGEEVRVTAVRDISDRKEKEKNILLLNERLLHATKSANIGIWEWDLKNKAAIWNDKMHEIFGIQKHGSMSYDNWLDYIHPDDVKKADIAISEVLKHKKTKQSRLKILKKDKSIRYIHASAGVITDENNKVIRIVGACIDISELKQAEKDKKSSEENFRLLFENSPLGIITALPNGHIVDANQALIDILGSPSIEETKKINVLTFPLLVKNGFADDFKRAIKTGKVIRREYYYKSKWGKSINLWQHIVPLKDKEGRINRLYVIFEDITERKYVENELLNQKKLFETTFNAISDAIIITNTERMISLPNEGALKMFKYSIKDIVGKKTDVLYAEKLKYDDAGERIFNKDAIKNKELYITKYKDKTGRIFVGETFGAKLFNENGDWIGNLGVIRDVSERINMIDELKHAKEKAEESNKLKSAFLNNLSHEIRTPMNSIVGFSQLLKSPQLAPDKRIMFIDRITKGSHQLLSIVEDIIHISKIDSQQIDLVENELSVNKLMTELYNNYHLVAREKNIKLTYIKSIDTGRDLIFTDQSKLKQVLDNLISNAIKFTQEGSVTFGCKIVETLHEVSLQFYVKDTGIGIDKSMHNEIFDRFRQVELSATREFGGLGLGLAISKAYIELMGGEISLESELNKGSGFYFSLPYKPVNKEWLTHTNDEEGIKSIKWNNKTILIAEDDDMNYLLLVEILNITGVNILHAKTGREAIDICLSHNPDLVLMDIKMPDLDGYQATKIIKEQLPNLPVIAQTAYAHPSDEQKAKDAGLDAYIEKPIIEEQLLKIISEYLKD
ncbi:MAG: hypothetical protein DRI95_04970 [Bacteroidetes bacterium]|nr:MAG: hypothetical protein DRI95_04970 [Bacteroidota bacterium]